MMFYIQINMVFNQSYLCGMICHVNSSRRIFVLRVILLLYLVDLWLKLLKNDGVQFF